MATTTYRVTGPRPFPLDMLRYDASWPSTSQDVVAIDPGQYHPPFDGPEIRVSGSRQTAAAEPGLL